MKIWSTIKNIFWVFLCLGSLVVLLTAIKPFGYKVFVVQSGSMEPQIKTGSIVVSRTGSDYKKGEVITFNMGNSTVTHRVVTVTGEGTDKVFQTKGDANSTADAQTIRANQIVGRVVLTVPYIGYGVNFVQTLPGLIIFLIIPGLIIVSDEIIKIRDEWSRISKKKAVDPENKSGESIPPIILKGLLLITFSSVLMFGTTSAYFSDTVRVSGNTFSIGYWDKVVINEVYYTGHEEWIELYNPGPQTVDIKGWEICNSAGDCGTLNPAKKTEIRSKHFVLVSHSASNMKGWNVEENTPQIYYAGGWINFNDSGDTVVLKNTIKQTVDMMSYGSSTLAYSPSSPLVSAQPVQTLERNPSGKDTNQASDFVVRTVPTPGI